MCFVLKSHERDWITQTVSVFEYLWVVGLAFVVLALSFHLPSNDVCLETTIYLCLGTVFPLVAVLVCLCERFSSLSRFVTILKIFFVLYALYQFRDYWFGENSFVLFCCFPVLCATVVLHYWQSQADRDNLPKRCATAFLIFLISLVCWIAVQRMFVGEPSFVNWLVTYWQVIPVLIAATALSVAVLFRSDAVCSTKRGRWFGHLVAFCLFIGLSFQTDGLHDYRVYLCGGGEHHWGFWIGPVESVRDGGWLLWNVPSQYGFLNILTIAALPIVDAWEAMYLVQSVLLFLVTAMIYGLLCQWGMRLYHYLFALLFTLSVVFLLPGSISGVLSGVQPWPSMGPLRYFWLLASIGALWYFLGGKRPNIRHYLWFGSFCWVTGILWSFESGVFCSTVFMPAVCVLLLQYVVSGFQSQHSLRAILRGGIPFIFIPLGMLSITLGFIWIYYQIYLGSGPDLPGYYEYALVHVDNKSLSSSFLLIQDQAEVFIAAICIFATIVIWKIKVHPLSPQVALALGVWFGFWSSLLLFVTIKHPPFNDNGTTFALGVGILIPLVDGISHPLLARLVRYGLLPIIVILLAITYFHPDLPRVFRNLQLPEKSLARSLYPMDPSACLLLDYAGVGMQAPLVCDYQGYLLPPPRHQEHSVGPYTNSHSWLPKPLVMLSALPVSRQDVYIDRWLNRMVAEGWLLLERPRLNRACRLDRSHYPFLPKIIHKLTTLPVNHWASEFRLCFMQSIEGQKVIFRPTANSRGRLLLMKLKKRCDVQNVVENDHWALYRCVLYPNGSDEHGTLATRN